MNMYSSKGHIKRLAGAFFLADIQTMTYTQVHRYLGHASMFLLTLHQTMSHSVAKATQTKFIVSQVSQAFQLEKGMRNAHFYFILKAPPTNLKRGLDQVWTEFTWGAGRTAPSCQCLS